MKNKNMEFILVAHPNNMIIINEFVCLFKSLFGTADYL